MTLLRTLMVIALFPASLATIHAEQHGSMLEEITVVAQRALKIYRMCLLPFRH